MKPFIIDKNLGKPLDEDSNDFPQVNSDGISVIPLTEEQKYLFDNRGWLLIPNVLTADEIVEMREFCKKLHTDRDAIPQHERSSIGGPLQKLCDHENVVGFMNEFLAYPELSSSKCYGFRMESTNLFYKTYGDRKFKPHNGNGMLILPGDSHVYRCIPGKGYSGMTRVVWELTPVKYRQGGTLFISGSHKSVYQAPESIRNENSDIWDTYQCPAGSLLFFTEAVTHTGALWSNADNDRIAVFNCYNTVNSKWHSWYPNKQLLETMPQLRRTLFRPVHAQGNVI